MIIPQHTDLSTTPKAVKKLVETKRQRAEEQIEAAAARATVQFQADERGQFGLARRLLEEPPNVTATALWALI